MDRVELAFRKFDLNKDGFLSREEFDLVTHIYSPVYLFVERSSTKERTHHPPPQKKNGK
jgi:Ca2+-binding EF-hand superfamily protein